MLVERAPRKARDREQQTEIDHRPQNIEQAQRDRLALGRLAQRNGQRLKLRNHIVQKTKHIQRRDGPDDVKRQPGPELRADDQGHRPDQQPGAHQADRRADDGDRTIQRSQADPDHGQHQIQRQRGHQRQGRRQQPTPETGLDPGFCGFMDQMTQTRPEQQRRNKRRQDQSQLHGVVDIEHRDLHPIEQGFSARADFIDRNDVRQGGFRLLGHAARLARSHDVSLERVRTAANLSAPSGS